MIDELELFRGKDFVFNNYITIRQATLDEICDFGEQDYYSVVHMLCSTPSDYKVFLLDECGVDYEELDDFTFFSRFIAPSLTQDMISCVFGGGLDLSDFSLARDNLTGNNVLYDEINDRRIDESMYTVITEYVRRVHGFERRDDKPGNERTKQYLLNKERKLLLRHKDEPFKSILVPLISALVNCEQFKYDHKSVWSLNIYAFMDSVRRIQKYKNYNQVIQGYYAGTVDGKKLNFDDLDWLAPLK